MAEFSHLSDDALFAEILARRASAMQRGAAPDVSVATMNQPLGELTERWKKPACYVIRKIQQSYGKGAPEDELELFQESVRRLIERGLAQYRGISEMEPGRAASPRTFFLRIVKHLAIDHYRRRREELAYASADGDDGPEVSAPEAVVAAERHRRTAEREDAQEVYWKAFRRLSDEHPNEAAAWDIYHHQELGDHEACALALGISVSNSYKRVSRAQAHLRLYLLEMHS